MLVVVLLSILLSTLTLPWVSMLAPRQFLPAVLILACALMFLFVLVACGYVFLDREVASERNSRMFTFFIKNQKRVIVKRSPRRSLVGNIDLSCIR